MPQTKKPGSPPARTRTYYVMVTSAALAIALAGCTAAAVSTSNPESRPEDSCVRCGAADTRGGPSSGESPFLDGTEVFRNPETETLFIHVPADKEKLRGRWYFVSEDKPKHAYQMELVRTSDDKTKLWFWGGSNTVQDGGQVTATHPDGTTSVLDRVSTEEASGILARLGHTPLPRSDQPAYLVALETGEYILVSKPKSPSSELTGQRYTDRIRAYMGSPNAMPELEEATATSDPSDIFSPGLTITYEESVLYIPTWGAATWDGQDALWYLSQDEIEQGGWLEALGVDLPQQDPVLPRF